MREFRFVDLFCGGGGSITGAINAFKAAGEKYDGRGFDHWDLAIRTIQANHPEIVPDFERACAPIQSVLPDEIFDVDPERLDVLWASPSCTHHSVAAGGKPRSNQLRSQPEYLLPYLRLTRCRRLYVENVKELMSWGPVLEEEIMWKGKKYKAGQPDPRTAGKYFDLWLKEIKASGYKVETAILNAADYGAATSRERLIIQAVRKSCGEKIVWPEPTHSRTPDLFGLKRWRSAAEIIDWSIPGESIIDRKKPLCKNTMRRIEAGIKKYWGAWAEPFIAILHGKDCQFRIEDEKLAPFLMRYNGGDNRNHGVNEPIPVIDCSNRYGVISPVIPTHDRFGLVSGRILTLPDGQRFKLDITHRMLTAKELSAATSFPDDYVFAGNGSEIKKQIGNAVPPVLAEALYRAFLAA